MSCSRIRQDRGNLGAHRWRRGPGSVGGWNFGWRCCWFYWCCQLWQLSLCGRKLWLYWWLLRRWFHWWLHLFLLFFGRQLWRSHHHPQERPECHLSAAQWQINEHLRVSLEGWMNSNNFLCTVMSIVKDFFFFVNINK